MFMSISYAMSYFLTYFSTNSQFLSEMIATLFEGCGTTSELCTDYISKSVSLKYLQHSWVLGLLDPSHGSRLPAGPICTRLEGTP